MHKPKCRLCGHAHYASEPHVFGDDAVANVVDNIPKVVNKPLVVNATPNVVNRQTAGRSKDRHKDKLARRQYMREYMKKYRIRSGQARAD